MAIKNKDGKYDCLVGLADGEPYFVLRGQDLFAAQLVENWARNVELHGTTPAEKVAEARNVAQAMREWPKKKVPD